MLRPQIALRTMACSTIFTHRGTTMARGNSFARALVRVDFLILVAIFTASFDLKANRASSRKGRYLQYC
ncbi:MAG: hypothetical protein ACJATK_001810 [Paracoccaceae bacterium]|jgi:hypothetical protein